MEEINFIKFKRQNFIETMEDEMKKLSPEEQLEILRKNAVEIIPEEDLLEKLRISQQTGRPLRVKLGCDPSAPDLHIGHSVVLRKLRQFQELGHQAILVIGDFTAMIGDPSGKKKTRPALTFEETRKNAETYFRQAGKILDIDKLEIRYNSEWLGKMNFADVIKLASKFTVARMLERDDFEKRLREQIPISLHELLYPLAQAYDSVALEADVELGGTDQKFNLLVGRTIQTEYGQKPQAIITLPLLEGTDGVQKMSKSLGNYIAFEDSPDEIFGKTMSIPDELIEKYFRLATDISDDEIEKISEKLKDPSTNPMELKKRLAWELVRIYHSSDAADNAKANFEKVFSHRELPDEMPTFEISESARLIDILADASILPSRSEARRLIRQNAVRINGETITDENFIVIPEGEKIVKVGKRKFLKILPKS